MALLAKPIEQPWAVQHRKGFKGGASGLYFQFFEKLEEAEAYQDRRIRKGQYVGKIEHRPGESWYGGTI